jgi:hypothetical protein
MNGSAVARMTNWQPADGLYLFLALALLRFAAEPFPAALGLSAVQGASVLKTPGNGCQQAARWLTVSHGMACTCLWPPHEIAFAEDNLKP